MRWLLIIYTIVFPNLVFAGAADHGDPVAPVILGVTIIFFLGLIGRYLALMLHQPGVLGELLMGVFIGNIAYFFGNQLIVVLREGSAIFNVMAELLNNIPLHQAVAEAIPNPKYAQQVITALSAPDGIDLFKIAYVVDIFSRYGVIFLLFMVGLESSVQDLKHTGKESVYVAIIGVVVPMILGFLVACLLMSEASLNANLFVGATLCATSIGITARVLREMQILRTREAKTILGAAMLDDILGLIILAVVSSVVIQGQIDFFSIIKIICMAFVFFILVIVLSPWILRKSSSLFGFMELWEAKLFIAFVFLMVLAWFANLVQLATIVGAFAAGVVMHDDYFKRNNGSSKTESFKIKDLVAPLEFLMTPIFFVLIGLQVKIETFFDWHVLILALALIVAAIVGKLVSGFGAHKKDDRWLIGIGMLPRGEVGLVFASIGRTLGVISDTLFSAIVLMVIVTTFIAPPLLKARYTATQNRLQDEN